MPLGTEHALVAGVSIAALTLGALFAGIWWSDAASARARPDDAILSPAPFKEAFCEHRIDQRPAAAQQIIVRVNPLPQNPPPPREGIRVAVLEGPRTLSTDVTDVFACASLLVAGSGSYSFEAAVEETYDNATHKWWSNAVTRFYDGESPGFLEIRLNNYARYA
jgi:hypothetical protein